MTTMNLELHPAMGRSVIEGHPRGRGFGILSRLARAEDISAPEATVLTFEPRQSEPRHRRDVATDAALLG